MDQDELGISSEQLQEVIRRLGRREEEAEQAIPFNDPTLLNWEEEIIPELRRFLFRRNTPYYEIEEWVRRIRAQMMLGNEKALLFVAKEMIGPGIAVPKSIMHFFPPHLRQRNYRNQQPPEGAGLLTFEGTKEATAQLKEELELVKMLSDEGLDFVAGPSANDLYHWNLRLRNFEYDTPLGQDLTEYTLRVDENAVAGNRRIEQAEILIEIKFAPDYPHSAPQFRLIRPGLRLDKPIVSLNAGHGISLRDSTPRPDGDHVQEASTITSRGSNPLTFSTQLEGASKKGWSKNISILEIVSLIREALIKTGARVDMATATPNYGLPTINSFWHSYSVLSPAHFNKPEVEQGGKIILPLSAIEELTRELDTQADTLGLGGFQHNPENTITFEITGKEEQRLFCGVLEFTAGPGQVCIPKWMMNTLGIEDGDQIQLRRVSLAKGTFVKIQPHSADFHNSVDNPKAMLEWLLPNYVALTAGQTLVLNFNQKEYHLTVLEVSPGRAISLIDTNINLDFAAPLSGEIKPLAPTLSSATEEKEVQPGVTLGDLDTTNLVEGTDFKLCTNCLKPISISSFAMHDARCARMNWRCEKCGAVLPTAQRQEHLQTTHSPKQCDQCGEQVESYLLANHQAESCKKRLVQCDYCDLKISHAALHEHQVTCGEITDVCTECKQRVRRKDSLVHPSICAASNQSKSAPVIAAPSLRRSQSVFLCERCSTPHDTFEDLQVHMLTAHHDEMTSVASGQWK